MKKDDEIHSKLGQSGLKQRALKVAKKKNISLSRRQKKTLHDYMRDKLIHNKKTRFK